MQYFRLFDLVVASPRPLAAESVTPQTAQITIVEHSYRHRTTQAANAHGYNYEMRADGTVHVSWSDLFDFIVSADGSRIDVFALPRQDEVALYTYLISQVISIALLQRNIESWHGTAVTFGDDAIVFLGNCGYGKSTLSASLIAHGAQLLSDDLIVLQESDASYLVTVGAQRLKLEQSTASAVGLAWRGRVMDDGSGKMVFEPPVIDAQPHSRLAAIVVIEPFADSVRIEQTKRPEAVRELLAATFNPLQADSKRLQHLLRQAEQLAAVIPVYRLHTPRDLAQLASMRAAISRHFPGFVTGGLSLSLRA